MSFGHPDFADVRRHYYAAQIDHQTGTLNANQTAQFSYNENQLGDVFVLSGFLDVGIIVQVLRNNTGVPTEGMGYAAGGALGGNLWIPIHPTSSTMLVDVENADGVAGRAYNLTMQAFIGSTVGELAQRERTQGTTANGVGAGARGALVAMPATRMFDRVTITAESDRAMNVDRDIYLVTDFFPTALHVSTELLGTTTGAGVLTLDVPVIGAAESYFIVNAGAAGATTRVAVRLYRGPTTT